MKTICFDLRALQIGHENRGIGMYIRSVLENMPHDENRYVFYCFDKNNPIEALDIKTAVDYEIVQTPTISTVLEPKNILGILKLVNHRFSALKSYKIDTFVQFDFMLSAPRWSGVKKIVIGYDLIPMIKRNEYMPSMSFAWNQTIGKKAKVRATLRAFYYRLRYWLNYRVYKRADKVVCISQDAVDSFAKLLNISQKRLTSIPLAPVSSNITPDDSVADMISKPYIFYIGGTDSRKQIKDIVHAFNIARGRGSDVELVFAGNEFRDITKLPDILGRNAIMESPYNKHIHLAGFISDAQKIGLYNHAHAFVFASNYEGFGLPVIEAMAASCPVISYNNSSIPEAAGDAALLVKTGDVVSIAHNIASLYDDTLRNKLIKAGKLQAKKFSWQKYVTAFQKTL